MNGIRLETRSVQTTLKNLKRYGKNIQQGIGKQVEKTAVIIEHKAKSRVPVGKGTGTGGNLKSRIHRRVSKSKLSGSIGTNVHYSPYVEFGTGSGVRVPAKLTEYAMQFKGKGVRQVNRTAKPYLFNSAEEEREPYNTAIKKILKKVK